jgi:tetratricopeptide (TPR) repeat protein
MFRWKITGVIATAVIAFSIPLYYLKARYIERPARIAAAPPATFSGSESCKSCHKAEYDKWKGSHHDHAMEVANETTVLGDFNNASFEHFGVMSRFYRKDGRFFVHTQGPQGRMGDFEITYTFGYYPLQQYLVPFPGGRLQCLPIAWDVKKRRWYHLPPDAPVGSDDWLYWTHAGQNWNGMCAECHSTDLKKNYDPERDRYQTTWSDIDVGCEACHGPGSRHVQWAELPDMARPRVENDGLAVKTSGLSSRQMVELCAPCHSRRTSLGDNSHVNQDLMDLVIPQLLNENLYYADGQILEEDYVYGSFVQSKMYDRQVRCSDCHEVHSIKRHKEGNDLCLQCHRAAVYDTKNHHFHKKREEPGEPIKTRDGEILFDVGSGALCEACHMPGRLYMGIDYRLDHSFRIPRPDLSAAINVPNACNRCHVDKTNQWSMDYITKWYGQKRKFHYGSVLEAGRRRVSEAQEELIRLAGDRLYPAIVRSTALALLNAYPSRETTAAFERALVDEEPLVRETAVRQLPVSDPRQHVRFVAPLLWDKVKAVRIEAAMNLTAIPTRLFHPVLRRKFLEVLDEYRAAMLYTADFAPSRHNLGNMYANLGDAEEAVKNYQQAIKIDDQFYPAKVNLAMLYNRMGKNADAERLLLDVLDHHRDFYDVAYSLGLLLAEEKKYEEAVPYLQQAAKGLPQRARVQYNLGLALQFVQKDREAEAALERAVELDPQNMDFLYALADFYLKRQRMKDLKRVAEKMIDAHPNERIGHELLRKATKN